MCKFDQYLHTSRKSGINVYAICVGWVNFVHNLCCLLKNLCSQQKFYATDGRTSRDKYHVDMIGQRWQEWNMILSFCPLTTSNQKLSKHDARCFLSRFMSHRPPFLFLSSSHIGFIPSWNIFVRLSGLLYPTLLYPTLALYPPETSWCDYLENI